MPNDGISPTRWRIGDLPQMGFSPLEKSRMYAPRQDVPPRGSVNTGMPTGFSRSSYRSQNPSLWDLSHSKSHSAVGISPSQSDRSFGDGFPLPHLEDHVCTLLNGMFSHMEALTQRCLRVFLDRPTGVKTLHCGISSTQSLALLQGFPLS